MHPDYNRCAWDEVPYESVVALTEEIRKLKQARDNIAENYDALVDQQKRTEAALRESEQQLRERIEEIVRLKKVLRALFNF